MTWLSAHWLNLNSLELNWFGMARNVRSHAIRAVAVTAILLGAPPAWPQIESMGAPNPENVLNPSTIADFFARFSRPQTAEAAPRANQKQTQRVRTSRAKIPAPEPEAAPEQNAAAQDAAAPEPQPQPQAWPNAQDSVGAAGLVPVVIKTVREMVETEAETSPVPENELSDIDLAAQPVASRDIVLRDEPVVATDGRASTNEAEWRAGPVAAFAENLKTIGTASWLEPVLLVLAGAVAAVTAMRVFAV